MENRKNILLLIVYCLTFAIGCSQQNQFDAVEPAQTKPVLVEAPEVVDIEEDPGPKLNQFSQTFLQKAEEKKVDLLIVVDNSTSMIPDQEKLSREFSNFISHISDSDYRIGVITTDTTSLGKETTPGFWGNLDVVSSTGYRYISKRDANPEDLFKDLINRKETIDCDKAGRPLNCVSYVERPLTAVKMAIEKRNGVNSGFFRKGADLGIIIITDEDETALEDGTYFTAQNLLDYFKAEFGESKKLVGFNISIPEGDTTCLSKQASETNTNAATYGKIVSDLSTLTEGLSVNICNENFSMDLSNISSYVEKNLLPFVVEMPKTLLMDSVVVKMKGKKIGLKRKNKEQKGAIDNDEEGYVYIIEDNQLRLLPTPEEGMEVAISYEYGEGEVK